MMQPRVYAPNGCAWSLKGAKEFCSIHVTRSWSGITYSIRLRVSEPATAASASICFWILFMHRSARRSPAKNRRVTVR